MPSTAMPSATLVSRSATPGSCVARSAARARTGIGEQHLAAGWRPQPVLGDLQAALVGDLEPADLLDLCPRRTPRARGVPRSGGRHRGCRRARRYSPRRSTRSVRVYAAAASASATASSGAFVSRRAAATGVELGRGRLVDRLEQGPHGDATRTRMGVRTPRRCWSGWARRRRTARRRPTVSLRGLSRSWGSVSQLGKVRDPPRPPDELAEGGGDVLGLAARGGPPPGSAPQRPGASRPGPPGQPLPAYRRRVRRSQAHPTHRPRPARPRTPAAPPSRGRCRLGPHRRRRAASARRIEGSAASAVARRTRLMGLLGARTSGGLGTRGPGGRARQPPYADTPRQPKRRLGQGRQASRPQPPHGAPRGRRTPPGHPASPPGPGHPATMVTEIAHGTPRPGTATVPWRTRIAPRGGWPRGAIRTGGARAGPTAQGPPLSVRAGAVGDRPERTEQDVQVADRRPVVDIAQVEPQGLLPRTRSLRPLTCHRPGHAGADMQSTQRVGLVLLDLGLAAAAAGRPATSSPNNTLRSWGSSSMRVACAGTCRSFVTLAVVLHLEQDAVALER
jgi:hypothetical protein